MKQTLKRPVKTSRQPNLSFQGQLHLIQQTKVRCVLSEVMGRHRITQTALAKASRVRPGSIGALYRDQTQAISMHMMGRILHGLHELTGVPYTPDDLFRIRFLEDLAPTQSKERS